MKLTAAGVGTFSASGWFGPLARAAARDPRRRRSCVLLWMNGGPSTIDLWDLKPGHSNGGPFREIDTAVPGVRIGEHLRQVAGHMRDLSTIRSMSTPEGDHDRAVYHLRTGQRPLPAVAYPTLGALVAKEFEDESSPLPPFVSINSPQGLGPNSAYGPGFLGARYAPLAIGDAVNPVGNNAGAEEALRVQNITPAAGVSAAEADSRLRLLRQVHEDFAAGRTGAPVSSHRVAYRRAAQLMQGEARTAFDLEREPPAVRDRYGRNRFGQGCLLARRLIERGVPFVEVDLGGWDTHDNNFDQVRGLCEVLDPAWAALMGDLRQRGLLETTTILWMGEFGRTPRINGQTGRDHWPNSWAVVLGGGGVRGGRVVGSTNADGTAVERRPVSAADLIATVCLALGLDPARENITPDGRPIRLADRAARPVRELVGG
jgi:hypothetical protein